MDMDMTLMRMNMTQCRAVTRLLLRPRQNRMRTRINIIAPRINCLLLPARLLRHFILRNSQRRVMLHSRALTRRSPLTIPRPMHSNMVIHLPRILDILRRRITGRVQAMGQELLLHPVATGIPDFPEVLGMKM